MKKIILTMALAIFSMTGITAMAQQAKTCDKTNCEKKCDKKSKCEAKGAKACNPFEGLTLTQEQQTKLAVIPCPKKVMEEAKKQCKGDTAQCNPQQRISVVKDIRSNYLAQVKAILTPEQYVQFLENTYVNQMPAKGDKMKGDKKKFKGEKKGDRRERGQRPERKADKK